MKLRQNNSSNSSMRIFFTGLSLGAALGILYAPEKGKKIRGKLVNQSNKFDKTVNKKLKKFDKNVNKQVKNAKKEIMNIVQEQRSMFS